MIPAIKAEFRKLITIRSTYVILAACLAIEVLFAFYGSGIKSTAADLRNPGYLADQVVQAVNFLSVVLALVGVFLVTHEYRYNTILYTFTSAKRRTSVFFAKFIVISIFATLFALIFGALSPLMATLGTHLAGHTMAHQVIPYTDLLWRSAFAGWAFATFAFTLAVIIRAQIGAVISIFLIPSTIEPLLGIILKGNKIYLPFAAQTAVLIKDKLSFTHAAMVAGVYMVVGMLVAWVLFVRRDAS